MLFCLVHQEFIRQVSCVPTDVRIHLGLEQSSWASSWAKEGKIMSGTQRVMPTSHALGFSSLIDYVSMYMLSSIFQLTKEYDDFLMENISCNPNDGFLLLQLWNIWEEGKTKDLVNLSILET
jgi:hypothetical protein